MKITSLSKILAVALLLFVNLTFAEKMITATSDPYPPYADQNSPNQGLSLEIVREAFKTQDYKVEMKFQPWARALLEVTDNTIDIIPHIWKTEKRLNDFVFSDPFLTQEMKFIKKNGDNFEFDGLKSLTGKTVGTIRGYSYSEDFSKATNFEKEEVNTVTQNVGKMMLGRVDLTVDDEITTKILLKKENPELLGRIVFCKNILSKNDVYIVCGKNNPKAKELISSFNAGLKVIKANGTYDKILKSYIK